MATAVVGVDLGGTNVRAAVVGRDGTLLAPPVQYPSRAQEGFALTLEQITLAIREAIAAGGVSPAAIGMAVPGHIDATRGVVRWHQTLARCAVRCSRYGVMCRWRTRCRRG